MRSIILAISSNSLIALHSSYREAACRVGQQLASGVGDEDVVLDPDAAEAGNVRARLDGEDHPGGKLDVGLGVVLPTAPDAWTLVNLETEAVPRPVAERVRQPPGRQHLPGRSVDRARPDTG